MEYLNLDVDPTTLALLSFFGIGLATLVEQAWTHQWKSVTKILVCTVGLALVALAIDGVTIVTGAAIGLNASGLLTTLSFIGKGKTEVNKVPVSDLGV